MRVDIGNGLAGLLRFADQAQHGDGKLRVDRDAAGCYDLRSSSKGPGIGASKGLGMLARKRKDVAEFLGSLAERQPQGPIRNQLQTLRDRATHQDIRRSDLEGLLALTGPGELVDDLALDGAPSPGHTTLLYVPGLAVLPPGPDIAQREGETDEEFEQRRNRAFQRSVDAAFPMDQYQQNMVRRLMRVGATPVPCQQSLAMVPEWPGLAAQQPGERSLQARPPRVNSHAEPDQPTHPAEIEEAHHIERPVEPADLAQIEEEHDFELLDERKIEPKKKDLSQVFGDSPANAVLSKQAGKPAGIVKMSFEDGLSIPSAPGHVAQPGGSPATGTALAQLKDGDTLYVVGHSSINGAAMSFKMPTGLERTGGDDPQFRRVHIDPAALARQLIDEGLPRDSKCHVVLVSCFSAGTKNRGLMTMQPLTNRLKEALRGYQCKVYGATGLTHANRPGDLAISDKVVDLGDNNLRVLNGTPREIKKPKATFYLKHFRAAD